MYYSAENESFTLGVKSFGAELSSLKSKKKRQRIYLVRQYGYMVRAGTRAFSVYRQTA